MTAQPALPFGPRARRRDPSPSHLAARDAERFAASHIGRIVRALVAVTHEPRCLSTHELADATGLTVVQLDRRGLEAEAAGWVFRLDQGGVALDWFATEKARTWAADNAR